MNKIAVVMMVKNEMDIIESCVRHAAMFADKIFVCDHNSTDGTFEILKSLREEGLSLEISRRFDTTQDQFTVTNEMTHYAIERGMDIIVPVDADEFLIMSGGKSSQDLRALLQNLDSSQIYEISWTQCAFVDNNHDQDKFVLNRPTIRSERTRDTFPKTDGMYLWNSKVIVGSAAMNQLALRIVRGNHFMETKDGKRFKKFITLDEIEMFHYRYRGHEQWLSKDLCKFLARILDNSMYGDLGAKIMRRNVKNFLAGKEFNVEDTEQWEKVTNPFPADSDLAPYCEECNLKFGGGGVNPLQNIFRTAMSIAIESKLKDIIQLGQIVRIFIFHEGNAEKTNRSIESALIQNYPLTKIYVVLLSKAEINNISINDKILLVSSQNFTNILMRREGSFVQFVVAGDCLMRDRIANMVQVLTMNEKYDLCFSEASYPKNQSEKFYFLPIESPNNEERYYDVGKTTGVNFFKNILKTGQVLQSGITRAFFKQKYFIDENLLDAWIADSDIRASQLILWNSMIVPTVTLVYDSMIEPDDTDWSQQQLISFMQIWETMVESAKESEFFSLEEYQDAQNRILEWKANLQ